MNNIRLAIEQRKIISRVGRWWSMNWTLVEVARFAVWESLTQKRWDEDEAGGGR